MNLNEFLGLLKATKDDDAEIDLCRKAVLHGTPNIFRNREDDFYLFRKRIAEKFDIAFYEVYIVGSAKLGFSPHKGKVFDLESDVDVAIVSNKLYEKILESIYRYQMELRQSRVSVTDREISLYHKFLEYVAIGWIRPDKLPNSFQVGQLRDDWFVFFGSISNGKSEVGNYRVSAGVFKNYRHLEEYTLSGLKALKRTLEVES